MINNRKYIEVEILFKADEAPDYESMGIKQDVHQFETITGVIFTDTIEGFNESNYKDVTAIHSSGGSFLVKGNYELMKSLILE